MKKTFAILLALTFLSAPVYAGKKVKIYDEMSHYKGYVDTKSGKIYDEKSHYKGHVERSGKVYDENSRYKGHVEKEGRGKKSKSFYDCEESDD